LANELGVSHHLIAAKAGANRSKGKRGPEEWLPSDESYVCEYVRDWIEIKVQWELSVSVEEKAALNEALSTHCSEDDKGVKQDAAEAVKWYRKAAEQGYARAQFNLGLMYAEGKGVMLGHFVSTHDSPGVNCSYTC
jgi:TPR repeat protein